ncbi:33514_t:CDS:2, partial [Racocetra persica]
VFGENLDPQLVFDCVIAADELAILDLLKYAQRYLLENQITWLKENLALIYLRPIYEDIYDDIGLKSCSKKLLPSRGAIVSTIMSSQHAAIIASWIDRGSNLNGQRNNNGKIGRVTDHVYALNCWRYNGPSFGKCDLVMHNGGILRFKHQSFSPQIMPTENIMMKIEDYEVFEVVEKIKDKNNTAIS